MRLLLLGKNGQVGWEAHRALLTLGDVYAFDSSELNLLQFDKLREKIRQIKPDIILNASAYTDVDRAETESEIAFAVNAKAPSIMAEEAKALKSVLIHYSTDYVFDGKKGNAYKEIDATNPLNVYGQSKLAGEQAICQVGGAYVILRTSWVYSLRGNGFVSKVLSWSRKQEVLKIVSDQIGSPTWARMLADNTALLIGRGGGFLNERTGVYHLAGAGEVSRLEWAKKILSLDRNKGEQVVREILPSFTHEFPTPAERPLFSALDCMEFEKVFGLKLSNWEEYLQLAMEI